MSNELRYWLALNHLHQFDAVTVTQILPLFGSMEELFNALQKDAKSLGVKESLLDKIVNFDWHAVDQELAWAQQPQHYVITCVDARYPKLLREIDTPPLLLFIQGEVDYLSQPQLAIIGSRNPTSIGMEIAEQFATALSASGLVITSGLAIGIDTAAHLGALPFGVTMAVLGTGLNNVYPARNADLAARIMEKGALVSEFPLLTPPLKANFPRRNRIISGLSLGVLVVEASLYSGSLITARLAGEQGREIFAIPGSIHNPLSHGCHRLIRDGAKLVEQATDILEELKITSPKSKLLNELPSVNKEVSLDAKHKMLLSCIGFATTSTDLILKRSQLAPAEVSTMLIFLELQGIIKREVGGYVRV